MSVTTEENTTGSAETRNVGRVEEVQGVVIEAVFPDKLPEINHAILIKRPDAARAESDEDIAAQSDDYLTCEVAQHLGDDRVRAVAMDTTDGLARGDGGHRHRRPDLGPRGPRHARAHLQPARRADRSRRADARRRRTLADPPGGAKL